jgi:glycosyltransferase involved in cell wall biosynthesis
LPGTKTVLCISRWSHGKGLEYLLDAVPHIIAVLPDVRFILAGRKESSWENDVTSYVRKIDEKIAKMGDHVQVYGWVDDATRAMLCKQADVVVMPSVVEYFPYAILEPAAEGIPIVSSRIAGAQEILQEGIDCLMYDPMDVTKLAENILALLCNSELADRLAASAYNRVSNKYTWDKIRAMYCRLYEEVIASTPEFQQASA